MSISKRILLYQKPSHYDFMALLFLAGPPMKGGQGAISFSKAAKIFWAAALPESRQGPCLVCNLRKRILM